MPKGKIRHFSQPSDKGARWVMIRTFFRLLSASGSVTYACKVSGVNMRRMYQYRNTRAKFAKHWARCWKMGVEHLEGVLMDRAVHGVKKPVFYKGGVCGEIIEVDNTLALKMLAANKPKYAKLYGDGNKQTTTVNVGMAVPQGDRVGLYDRLRTELAVKN